MTLPRKGHAIRSGCVSWPLSIRAFVTAVALAMSWDLHPIKKHSFPPVCCTTCCFSSSSSSLSWTWFLVSSLTLSQTSGRKNSKRKKFWKTPASFVVRKVFAFPVRHAFCWLIGPPFRIGKKSLWEQTCDLWRSRGHRAQHVALSLLHRPRQGERSHWVYRSRILRSRNGQGKFELLAFIAIIATHGFAFVQQQRNLEWFPRLRAISLAVEEVEGEQNEWRALHNQLEATQELVKTLSNQLSDLRDQMTEQRKQKQRIGLLNNTPIFQSNANLGYHSTERLWKF